MIIDLFLYGKCYINKIVKKKTKLLSKLFSFFYLDPLQRQFKVLKNSSVTKCKHQPKTRNKQTSVINDKATIKHQI